MCTGVCSKIIAICLYVLAALSIICNIVLFFPDLKTTYVENDSEAQPMITQEIKYMGGVIGGGLMVLIPAIHIHLTSADKCCANRCGMFLSIGFAAAGVLGGLYSVVVASLGLTNGPACRMTADGQWGTPFANSNGSYLTDLNAASLACSEPENIVEFNVGLFSTLVAAASFEVILCAIQMVNGLFGCICGTCSDKE